MKPHIRKVLRVIYEERVWLWAAFNSQRSVKPFMVSRYFPRVVERLQQRARMHASLRRRAKLTVVK